MPPCCCPSTMAGLSTRPQSSTATCRSGTTCPVSVSTSTTDTCAPNGNVAPFCGTSSCACSEVSRSAAAAASWVQSTVAPGTPDTRNPSSASSTSSGDASSSSAASSPACSSTARAAAATALPPSCSDREPPVPPPVATRAVSDCTYRIRSMGIPSRSATIIANDVAWPWPVRRRPGHDGRGAVVCSIRTEPSSCAAEPGDLDVRRRPRSRAPTSPASRRRRCSVRSASTSATRSASLQRRLRSRRRRRSSPVRVE